MSLTKDQQLDLTSQHLARLQESKFYGQVTLDIQAGNILLIREQKTVKLEEVTNGNAGEEARESSRQDQKASAG